MERSDIINKYVENYGYETYLEVGLQSGSNRDKIKVNPKNKTTVDPDITSNNPTHRMTSDEFFMGNNKTFDAIFIDGLHYSDQVLRDILNGLEILNEGGTIFCHDMLPENEDMAKVPRITSTWTGDCWKAWFKLLGTRDDLEMFIVDTDLGVGVIRRGKNIPLKELNIPMENMQWSLFAEHSIKNTINKISTSEFIEKWK